MDGLEDDDDDDEMHGDDDLDGFIVNEGGHNPYATERRNPTSLTSTTFSGYRFPELQKLFQPGSTPVKGNRRYLGSCDGINVD
jgi:hypothetical protein